MHNMESIPQQIEQQLRALGSEEQARHLMRFFKTAPGEYGEGDRFLGVRVPDTRRTIHAWRGKVSLSDVSALLASEWHEVRLAGFLLLVEMYSSCIRHGSDGRHIVDYYLSMLHRGNNWDLVDVVAPKILGDWLVRNPSGRQVLFSLAEQDGQLWHQRVAIVSTWTLIRTGQMEEAIMLCEHFLTHSHDLIHKACGWMLREIGKRGGMSRLLLFLDSYAAVMPRTMLRYSIEQLPLGQRRHYMSLRYEDL